MQACCYPEFTSSNYSFWLRLSAKLSPWQKNRKLAQFIEGAIFPLNRQLQVPFSYRFSLKKYDIQNIIFYSRQIYWIDMKKKTGKKQNRYEKPTLMPIAGMDHAKSLCAVGSAASGDFSCSNGSAPAGTTCLAGGTPD